MYCAECAFSLPAGAKFCPRCSKRNVLAETTPGTAPEGASPQDEEAKPAPKTDTDLDGSASVASDEPGTPHRFVWEALEPESPPPPPAPSESAGAEGPKPRLRYANAGSITLGAFALVCLVVGAIQGFIPILLIEGVAFGGLAWLCAARWPLTPLLHSIVLVSSLLLAVLVGVTLDQDAFGPRYRYLSQGSVQYRVDEKAGRTDRLGNGGWFAVAFDREAEEVPANGPLTQIELTNGEWVPVSSGSMGGQVCLLAKNSSDYIVDRITISVKILKRAGASAGKDDALDQYLSGWGQQVVLKSYGGGFIGARETRLACGPVPRDLAADETWNFAVSNAYGWKR